MTQPTRADSPIRVRRVFLRYQHDDPTLLSPLNFYTFCILAGPQPILSYGNFLFAVLYNPLFQTALNGSVEKHLNEACRMNSTLYNALFARDDALRVNLMLTASTVIIRFG